MQILASGVRFCEGEFILVYSQYGAARHIAIHGWTGLHSISSHCTKLLAPEYISVDPKSCLSQNSYNIDRFCSLQERPLFEGVCLS